MSNNFIPTKRGNPCQICGDEKGKCRETETIRLCMSLTEAIDIPGFKFTGLTSDDLWGKWIEDDGQNWTEQQRQNWRQEQQQLKEQRAREEAQRRSEAMPAIQRDRYYRRLIDSLPLHPADRADLQRRGLTDEQIQAGGFKSVEQWQKLDFELPYNLPGVNLDGRSLNTSSAGYLCPIRDADGLIVGCQLRVREAADGGRYRWLSSATKKRPNGATPHLPNGELPLAVFRQPNQETAARLLLEGTGPKPLISFQRLGLTTIGAAGGQFASSPEQLRELTQQQTIVFPPDAGAVQNDKVLRQYRKTWKLLQEWDCNIQIAWWGQVEKGIHPDIDELTDYSQIQYLSIDEFEAIAANHQPENWLSRIVRTIQRRHNPLDSAQALQSKLEGDRVEIFEYEPGQRLQTWTNAFNQKYRYVLDASGTGGGKSYDAGNVSPSLFGEVRQVIYVSGEHRNPTTESLEAGWVDLEARHRGLAIEATPNGGKRVKRASKGETPTIAPNCNRVGLIEALRGKDVDGADTASVVCGSCPMKEACQHAEGPGYGFLYQRRSALSSPKLRAHPDSLPSPVDYDYPSVALMWDEPGQSFKVKREIQVTLTDLQQTMTALLTHNLLELVQELLSTLLPYLNKTTSTGRYGLSHLAVIQQLPDVSGIDITEIERAIAPNLGFLNTTEAYGADLKDLPASLRKRFSERDGDLARLAESNIIKQWLPDLLRVIQGTTQGYLHLHSGKLTISLPDERHWAIIQAAKGVVFLDATLDRDELALKLGCQPNEIFVCREQVPSINNLTTTQVTDMKRLGMQRGDDQERRLAALIKHYQAIDPTTKVIDFKKFATDGQGVWWKDSRGSNDFLACRTLVLVGTPCQNLNDLRAEYAILVGRQEDNAEGFKQFCDRRIRADVVQAIGRLRAHRRTNEQLQVVIVSNFDLQLPNVTQVRASDITLEAAGKKERFTLAVQRAIEQLKAAGQKVTQSAIAALTGYCQQYVSRHRKLLQTLLDGSNSKSGRNFEPDEHLDAVASVLDAAAAEGDTPQLAAAIAECFFEWLEPKNWADVYARLQTFTQIRMLECLFLTLPDGEMAQLEAAIVGMTI